MLENYLERLENSREENVKFFLITRKLKEGIPKSRKMLDKYDFMLYQIRISDEIRCELLKITISKIALLIKKNYEYSEYEVIDSDEKKIYTYQMENKTLSFVRIMEDSLLAKREIPFIESIDDIYAEKERNEELWAYCIGIMDNENTWSYLFRKASKGNVFIDAKENPEKLKTHNKIRTFFDVNSAKLEMLHGDTILLDKNLDCLYIDDKFYIFQKYNFEQILGLEYEYKEKAEDLVEELETSNMIEGIDLLKDAVTENPSIHKKLVRIYNNPDFKNLSKKRIIAMQGIANDLKLKLKIRNNKLCIEDKSDINIVIRMLEDYYLESKQTGNKYGSAVKKKLK